MSETKESKNKALVLEAFRHLVQPARLRGGRALLVARLHPAQRPHCTRPRRLFNLIKSLPASLRHEPGLIVAEGDYVMLHGRFWGEHRPVNWIGVDILRIADGVLAEHWDVLQDKATRADSKSGLPMFGDRFIK
jgi:predicted SnoaL-like aldol condensation-catalyzing enzyme